MMDSSDTIVKGYTSSQFPPIWVSLRQKDWFNNLISNIFTFLTVVVNDSCVHILNKFSQVYVFWNNCIRSLLRLPISDRRENSRCWGLELTMQDKQMKNNTPTSSCENTVAQKQRAVLKRIPSFFLGIVLCHWNVIVNCVTYLYSILQARFKRFKVLMSQNFCPNVYKSTSQ